MAEELTPPKGDDADHPANGGGSMTSGRGSEGKEGRRQSGEIRGDTATEGREEVLRELAKACKRQGNFHLACKKYTQAWRHNSTF